MGKTKNFAWSFTRHKSLRGCPRAHWFTYYRGGDPDAAQRLAYSRILTRPMLVGQVADLVTGMVLNHVRSAGKIPAPDRVEAVAREYTEKALQASAKAATAVQAGRVPYFGAQVLDDHVWGTEQVMTDEQITQKVIDATVAFSCSGIAKRLCGSSPTTWQKPRRREDPRPEAWQLGVNWVSSAPDCWLEELERFVVFDWKASRVLGQDDSFQLSVYGLWAVYARGWSPDQVYHQVVLMPTKPEYAPERLSLDSMQIAEDVVNNDCERERSIVDIETTRMGDVVYSANRERFPALPDKVQCSICKFRTMCPEALQ